MRLGWVLAVYSRFQWAPFGGVDRGLAKRVFLPREAENIVGETRNVIGQRAQLETQAEWSAPLRERPCRNSARDLRGFHPPSCVLVGRGSELSHDVCTAQDRRPDRGVAGYFLGGARFEVLAAQGGL